ncbi:lytic transglycosylase domain-containing protein [Robertkochia sediminum]|uniref:lytic transglycosylase domain-containing protein n=1 Tax=Robertkochia sediminum TaxID=2785326 RepID=UPI0019321F56|nr:lytic transglycosylase domain-containing protein [Robertkochia sediminum]MBL7473131.1 lytic transglycosylase domain-containing protein [Robertkochia sediminum]
MMNVRNYILAGGVAVVAAVFINAVQADEAVSESPAAKPSRETVMTTDPYTVKAVDIPKNINFAGEAVPLEDPDVMERLDRELLVNTYWQSNALLLIKRANKYFPVIEPILKEEGVPDDFKYLAVIESALTNAVSPAGARGFWQILKGTAREYGLEVNDNVDERYHLEKATRAACQYLKKSKERFGSWTLAAAAYNAGQYGMQKQLDRQKVDNYYDVLLGQETGRYVFRILALKEILTDPEKYGFHFEDDDLYTHIPTKKMAVDTVVNDFADFAKKFDINYKILKIHNPWLREGHLNNASRKEYFIEIPEEGYYPQQK